MKITGLKLENWMVHRYLDLEISPLTIIAGPNESGKSAIADALGFVIYNTTPRVAAKGDRPELISEGESKGAVTIRAGASSIRRDIATGKLGSKEMMPIREGAVSQAMPFLLSPGAFSRATPEERRALLSKVMRVGIDVAALAAEMQKRGAPDYVLKALPAGETLEKWQAEAKEQASQARGAWRQITGEAYGSTKAETWESPPPEASTADEVALKEALDAATAAMSKASGAVIAARSRDRENAQRTARISALKVRADKLNQALLDQKKAREQCSSAEMTLNTSRETRLPAGAMDTLSCPSCGSIVTVNDAGELEEVHAHKSAEEERAESAVTSARTALTAADDVVADAQRAVRDLQAAESEDGVHLSGDIATLETAEDEARTAHEAALAAVTALRANQKAIADAAKATAGAKAAHARVVGWMKAEAWLASDGIPGELLGRALQPFNATLAKLSNRANWKVVMLSESMGISVGGRTYGLHSESGQWRADVIIAVALAIHSDLRMVVVDRFDVLEPAARGNTLIFLRTLVKPDMQDMDTVVVMGTFKEAPRAPADVAVYWLGTTEKGA